ncbi:carbohydrate ABC transporter permease [Nocardia puris]|uniref:Carbohydrate ABC transporter membrane protein 2 (CUT1 family) n=1 Tax=Nocardia puris TaxID=208602 RepID=A0A366DQG0_9NOCA|nr:carbohydrate ABC transporter permease [Nocardia puris]MBF6213533.1 carbohydrate ABC transporter permease [Nocardia puris]MBF6365537.1 carbohydrate ABC transporter permease [Nocardia puris]MBF6460003.1 carbohydrate ABC transporter permease [Nocardia puris]RBO91514.1 carbohydrate ABC transporter membrane protein 2 (CUT1 family) [Nocardia puris]
MSTTFDKTRANGAVPLRKRLSSLRIYLGVLIVILWGLGPFYWMAVTAFRDPVYQFDNTPWPTHLTLENFRDVFDTSRGNDFGRALLNSVIIGSVTTVIALVIGIFAAYALARLAFRGQYVVAGLILSASMFPVVVLVTPLFQLFTNLGWIGKYQAMIIPNISFVLPLTVYILASFFTELPWELEEAARIDGASKMQAFRLIMLPLAAPAVFTTAILAFIASVNEYLLARLLSSDQTEPVTVAIARFSGNNPLVQPYAAIMAAGTIVTIPLVIMVLLFQRRIISGLTAGGVKS